MAFVVAGCATNLPRLIGPRQRVPPDRNSCGRWPRDARLRRNSCRKLTLLEVGKPI